MAGTNLSRANGSGSATTKFTYSVWLKYSGWFTGGQRFFSATGGSGDTYFRFNEDGTLEISGDNSAATSLGYFITNRKFRDHSAWMHIVIKSDTTQSTSTDRFKLYINGVDEAGVGGYSTGTYPNQNADDNISLSSNTHYIGGAASSQYFNGLMTHIHYSDGYAYDASTFGETDSTSGIWKPKASPTGITYGTNGYFLKMENSGAMGTDSSGNTNTFSVANGTLTQNVDTPSNNFCTWNRNFLTRYENGSTTIPGMLENGNATFNSTANAFYGYRAGTMGVKSGKWYWENKIIDNGRMDTGICYPNIVQETYQPFYDDTLYSAITINNSGEVYGRYTGSAIDSYASSVSFANNDIIGFALDMDNKALYIHKNGTYINSGNPTSGASRTGSVIEELTGTRDSYLGSGEFVSPYVGDPSNSGTFHLQSNFGGGYFGTTVVASANADDGGLGSMEYDVPANYRVICTKNIKDYG